MKVKYLSMASFNPFLQSLFWPVSTILLFYMLPVFFVFLSHMQSFCISVLLDIHVKYLQNWNTEFLFKSVLFV